MDASDAPEGYKPFKCVSCGLEGMAAPSKRARKFCYAPCKADEAESAKRRVARRAAIPVLHSKTCTKCGETKAVSEFNKAAKSHDGLNSACRICRNAAMADYEAANKEVKAARDLKRRTDPASREIKLAQQKQARDAARKVAGCWNKRVLLHDAHVRALVQFNLHDGHIKAWAASLKPVMHDAHVKEFKSDNTRYVKWKYHNLPRQMLYHRIKCWMHKHLGDKLPSLKWAAKLGYTTEELRVHLERQFTKGMKWENKGAWHIDHIRPVASFEFEDMDDPELLDCFGLCNLRPIWGKENLKKGAKREFLL